MSFNGSPALEALEKLAGPDAPDADVQALTSKRADLRRRVAIRFYERGFLDHPAIQVALRRLGKDPTRTCAPRPSWLRGGSLPAGASLERLRRRAVEQSAQVRPEPRDLRQG